MSKEYKKLCEASYDEYLKDEQWRRDWIAANRPEKELADHDKRMEEKQKKRDDLRSRFPYAVVLEGSYPEFDYVSRWCWQNIGEMDCEKCYESYSEFPGCPLILGGEKKKKTVSHTTSEGKLVSWEEEYYDVPEHSHTGEWTYYWLGKTGYDYGFGEFFFKNQADLDRFLAVVPTIDPWRDEEEGG